MVQNAIQEHVLCLVVMSASPLQPEMAPYLPSQSSRTLKGTVVTCWQMTLTVCLSAVSPGPDPGPAFLVGISQKCRALLGTSH